MKDKHLDILIKAAQAGGAELKKYFGESLELIQKSMIADFKTKADLESEKSIIAILKSEFPSYNIHSEEEGEIKNGSDYTFVIDPLDGTNNFTLGIPNFSVSVALLYKNEAVVGVIYHPILDKTYHAEKGQGAYLDGKPIKVNNITDPKNITIAYGCNYLTDINYLSKVEASFTVNDHKRILFNWAVAYDYCMLASGKIECIINDGTEIHDYAAGELIALEAGAKLIDFSGKEKSYSTEDKFIMSNSEKVNSFILNVLKPLQKH